MDELGSFIAKCLKFGLFSYVALTIVHGILVLSSLNDERVQENLRRFEARGSRIVLRHDLRL